LCGVQIMYEERKGLRARGRKNSKLLECAGRFFCDRDDGEWFTAKDIYYQMTFKNGNLYKNHRFARSYGTFRSHLHAHKGFKRKRVKVYEGRGWKETWAYSFDKNNYEKYWALDPHRARGKDAIYHGKGTKFYKDNQRSE